MEHQHHKLLAQVSALGESYRQSIISGTVTLLTCFLSFGIIFLSFSYWRQRSLQDQLKQRIARDLHDDMGSQLSHLALLAELGEGKKQLPEQAKASFQDIARESRALQHTMRDLVWLLEPRSANARDFSPRLRTICQSILLPALAEAHIDIIGIPPERPLTLAWARDTMLFIKETLNNCVRHSGSASATVVMEWTSTSFSFTVQDHGIGFDMKADNFAAGAGLRNLKRRAELLRGTVNVDSTPGHGTRIQLHVPLPNQSWMRWFPPWRK